MTIQKLVPPNNDDRLILRTSRLVPLGYKVHPEDTKWLVPIPEELEAIKQAKEYAKTCSVREVANWLSAKLKKKVSHMWVARNCSWGKRNKKYERYEGRYEVRRFAGGAAATETKSGMGNTRGRRKTKHGQADSGASQDSQSAQADTAKENPSQN